MADDDRVSVYEMSDQVRHWEVAFGGNGLARLYSETFQDARGELQSTSRLHFDGDVRPEIMRTVLDTVSATILAALPRGVCVVYRGHLVASFDYGGASAGSGTLPS